MGLFMQRPEHNDELPGLRAETAAERLADAAPVDAGSLDLVGLGGGGAVESIVIPVAPNIEIVQPLESGEDE
jgi:hypothetical protein